MATAGDVQRLFLQAIISRRVVPESLAKVLWENSVKAVNVANPDLGLIADRESQEDWDEFVKNINDGLDALDLEFRHLHDEESDRNIFALVNRKGDEVAQVATEYNAQEIAYFKSIVEQIMLAPREAYSVSSLLALREVSVLKLNITKSQAETVLTSFVARGWLLRSKRGRYSLSIRTLLELQSYLRATYPDEILECTICMEILTRGRACYTRACKARLHHHCLRVYQRRNHGCPACGSSWSGADAGKLLHVGEEAVKDGDDGRRRTRHQEGDEEDEEEEGVEEADYENEDPASQPQPSQSQPRTQRKGRASRAMVVEDEEEEEEDAEPSQSRQPARRSSRRQWI